MACNNFASTSNSSLAYGVQSVCGTPATDLIEMRFTSSSLQPSAESTQSNEIVETGDVTDVIRTSLSYAGSIGFEVSYENFDDFIAGALRSVTPLDGLGTQIKNGLGRKYFTMEEKRTSDADYYRVYTDVEVDTLSLSFETGAIATGSMDVIGRSVAQSGTSLDGTGYTSAIQNDVYNTTSNIGSVSLDGTQVSLVSAVSLDIATNKREQRALGTGQDVAGVGDGRMAVTGSLTLYFEDETYFNNFINDDDVSVQIVLDDQTGIVNGNQITIDMPRVKFTNITSEIAGVDQDLTLTVEFQALRDTGFGGTIGFTTLDSADV